MTVTAKPPTTGATILIGPDSKVASVASAITHCLLSRAYAEVKAIGKDQGYLALKACAAAQQFLADTEDISWGLIVLPSFFTKENERRPGQELTGLCLAVHRSAAK